MTADWRGNMLTEGTRMTKAQSNIDIDINEDMRVQALLSRLYADGALASGNYVLDANLVLAKPDGRAARGWESRKGCPSGSIVTLRSRKGDDSDSDEKGTWRCNYRLPGRYNHADQAGGFGLRLDGTWWVWGDQRACEVDWFLRLFSSMRPQRGPEGMLSRINPGADNGDWYGVLLQLIGAGAVSEAQVRSAYEIYWKELA